IHSLTAGCQCTEGGELSIFRPNVGTSYEEMLAVHRADDCRRNSAGRVAELRAGGCRGVAEFVRTSRAGGDRQHHRAAGGSSRFHAKEATVSDRGIQLDVCIDVKARAGGCSACAGAGAPDDPDLALVLSSRARPVVVRGDAGAAASGPGAGLAGATIQLNGGLTQLEEQCGRTAAQELD